MLNLRDYQIEAIESIRNAYRTGNRKVMYVLPTGGGKTVVFSEICRLASLKKKKTVIFVHRKELYYQASAAIYNHIDRENLLYVKVAMIQNSKKINVEDAEFVIFDEAHHVSASSYLSVIRRNPNMKILGVTATPSYESARVFDRVIYGPDITTLINRGYLSKFVYLCPKTIVDTAKLAVTKNDFDVGQIQKLLSNKSVYGDLAKIIKEDYPEKTFIVFCSNIQHTKNTLDGIKEMGVKAEMVTGDLDIRVRKESLEKLARREIRCVVACDAISEGVDVPNVDACILMRPTKSRTLYIQQVGRVLRPHPSKQFSYVIDLVGNVMIHGLPDMPPPPLKPPRQKKTESNSNSQKVEICKNCYGCYDSSIHGKLCPHCNYEAPLKPKKKKIFSIKNDEIIEVQRDFVKPELWNPTWDIPGWRYAIKDLDTVEKLNEFAKYKKYKKGWVHKIMESRKRR